MLGIFRHHRQLTVFLSRASTRFCVRPSSSDGSTTAKDVYRAPAVRVPTINKLQEIARQNYLDISDEEMNAYRDHMLQLAKSYDVIDSLNEPTLPVKYPRTPGYRPSPQENPLNAWYWRCDIKGAETGKLQGKTFAVKDNIPVAGVPMMDGSYVLEGYVPEYDATVISRILDAGGRILGKATCEDMCFTGSSFTCAKGAVPNPHNTDHDAGGSSSGSSVLLITDEVDMTLGGDQGGSIRIPSSWSGNVGLKTTYGLVPYTGIVPMNYTVDSVGPMTKNVYDCALLLEVIAGYDGGLDERQPVNLTVPEYTKQLSTELPDIKVGILKEGFDQIKSEEDVDKMVTKAAFQLRDVGAKVEEVSIPAHDSALDVYLPIAFEGAFQLMVNGSGGTGTQNRGFYATSMIDALHRGYRTRINDLAPTIKMLIVFSSYMRRGYGGRYYAKALNLFRDITEAYDKEFQKYDVLIMPTAPFKAPKLPRANSTFSEIYEAALGMLTNTAIFNATGHPALSINTGFSNGLPVGMMIVGRKFDESTVLKVAYAYEKLRDKN